MPYCRAHSEGSRGLKRIPLVKHSTACSGCSIQTRIQPRVLHASAEFGLRATARSTARNALATSPVKKPNAQLARDSASGSSLPRSIAIFAKLTASATSVSETDAQLWYARAAQLDDAMAAAGA